MLGKMHLIYTTLVFYLVAVLCSAGPIILPRSLLGYKTLESSSASLKPLQTPKFASDNTDDDNDPWGDDPISSEDQGETDSETLIDHLTAISSEQGHSMSRSTSFASRSTLGSMGSYADVRISNSASGPPIQILPTIAVTLSKESTRSPITSVHPVGSSPAISSSTPTVYTKVGSSTAISSTKIPALPSGSISTVKSENPQSNSVVTTALSGNTVSSSKYAGGPSVANSTGISSWRTSSLPSAATSHSLGVSTGLFGASSSQKAPSTGISRTAIPSSPTAGVISKLPEAGATNTLIQSSAAAPSSPATSHQANGNTSTGLSKSTTLSPTVSNMATPSQTSQNILPNIAKNPPTQNAVHPIPSSIAPLLVPSTTTQQTKSSPQVQITQSPFIGVPNKQATQTPVSAPDIVVIVDDGSITQTITVPYTFDLSPPPPLTTIPPTKTSSTQSPASSKSPSQTNSQQDLTSTSTQLITIIISTTVQPTTTASPIPTFVSERTASQVTTSQAPGSLAVVPVSLRVITVTEKDILTFKETVTETKTVTVTDRG